jgi:hypothetical protein
MIEERKREKGQGTRDKERDKRVKAKTGRQADISR